MQALTIPAAAGEHLNVLGHHQRLILTGADTGGAFALIEQISSPGSSVPVHYHEREEESFQVLEGRVRFKLGGEVLTATSGTTLFIPRGERHGFEIEGDSPARLLILLSPAGAEAMFRELASLPPGSFDPSLVNAICATHGNIFV